ncbi:MAG TPA: TldD/PmbA family protein [Actinomycetota bacterium]|jgi:predicted Zn-dependent protease|nr:TldD/PmbA family protein [Actinomycetota bacterium]
MPGLIGSDEFRRVAGAALELPGVDGVEVLFMHEWGGLTRFAKNDIHQSTAQEDTGLRVRVVTKDRVAVAASNDFSPKGARRAAESAKEMAEVVAPDPLWPGLAGPAEVPAADGFDEITASATPEQRADAVATLIAQSANGFTAAGAYETRAIEVGVANTEGQVCWSPWTQASLTTVISGNEQGSGFAETFAGGVAAIDPEAIGRRAAGKAEASKSPKPLDPGAYVVVLEPSAVSTVVGFLAWMGFNGRSLIEGRSCFTGKEGKKVAADTISIWDDATDSGTLGLPFDFEGVPRRRVDLIRDGVFIDAVYDMRTAKQAGQETTGHGLPQPNPEGPFPLNLFLRTGDATVEEMVAATERGVLVTRFHYSNLVNPVESSLTGMTRDGTFLIENGEIAGPVMNFRFTQSILEALSEVSMIGRDSELASEFFFSASRVPALKIEKFNFSGRSDH